MQPPISVVRVTTGTLQGTDLYYEERGEGLPILLIHPAGGSASTWEFVTEDLARAGRVITYDRRGYGRSGGEPVRSIKQHTADAGAILDALRAEPAVVVGASVGATIAIDLAIRRPDAVRSVIAYESPWRALRDALRHPDVTSLETFVTMWWLAQRGRHAEAASVFLRWAYSYPSGGSAWDAFPEEWRRIAIENSKSTIADVWIATGGYPDPRELATISTPVVCVYGARSKSYISRIARSLVSAIPTARLGEVEGAAHAVAFDAPHAFAQVIVDAILLPAGRRLPSF